MLKLTIDKLNKIVPISLCILIVTEIIEGVIIPFFALNPRSFEIYVFGFPSPTCLNPLTIGHRMEDIMVRVEGRLFLSSVLRGENTAQGCLLCRSREIPVSVLR